MEAKVHYTLPPNGVKTHSIKIVLAGQSGVGKSSLIARLKNDSLSNLYATIGVDFCFFFVAVPERVDEYIQVVLWDVAGNSRGEALTVGFFRDFKAAILIYSIDSMDSYEKLTDRWVPMLHKGITGSYEPARQYRLGSGGEAVSKEDIPAVECLLLGNKRDLADAGKRQIAESQAQERARLLGIPMIECSFKDDSQEAIDMILLTVVSLAMSNTEIEPRVREPDVSRSPGPFLFRFRNPLP